MEHKIIDYCIVSVRTNAECQIAILDAIKRGWQLYGYPFAGGNLYHQAMVRTTMYDDITKLSYKNERLVEANHNLQSQVSNLEKKISDIKLSIKKANPPNIKAHDLIKVKEFADMLEISVARLSQLDAKALRIIRANGVFLYRGCILPIICRDHSRLYYRKKEVENYMSECEKLPTHRHIKSGRIPFSISSKEIPKSIKERHKFERSDIDEDYNAYITKNNLS